MARLPTPGSDSGSWGEILNEYLTVEHNADGTLKSTGTLASKLTASDAPELVYSMLVSSLTAGPHVSITSDEPSNTITVAAAELRWRDMAAGGWTSSTDSYVVSLTSEPIPVGHLYRVKQGDVISSVIGYKMKVNGTIEDATNSR